MLATPTELTVSSADRYHAMGSAGGPFAWTSKTYTLKNPYATSNQLDGRRDRHLLQLSATSGTLAAGGSTTVTVSLVTATTAALTEGIYTNTSPSPTRHTPRP